MKKRFLTLAITTMAFLPSSVLRAQITIGLDTPPVSGALLQLKDFEVSGAAPNADRGLGMPRVTLTDMKNLYPMFTAGSPEYSGANKVSEDEKHIGLMVFHPDECTLLGKGLYVWESNGWTKLGDQTPAGLLFNPETLSLPSGQDFRSLSPINFDITWSPDGNASTPPTWAYQPGNYTQLNFTQILPASGSFSMLSPQTMSIEAAPMSEAEVTTNPFATKDRYIEFTLAKCNNQKKRLHIIQTNKAITIDGKFAPPTVVTSTAGVKTATLKSNATWMLKGILPATNPALSTVQVNDNGTTKELVANTTKIDWERENNTAVGTMNNLSYTVNMEVNKARYNQLIFTDANTPKRFSDITISVVQCNTAQQPKLNEWAALAGFTGVTETFISAADDNTNKINTPHPITGIAWHRDQDGNVFLSSSFDPVDANKTTDKERWMITNLSAKTYAPGVIHSAGRELSGPDGNANFVYNTAYWAYPKKLGSIVTGEAASAEYTNNPRLGLLYTWDAATAGKGGVDGEGNVDGELIESGFPEGTGFNQQKRRQGICPTGWHLPSDYEITNLERIIIEHKSLFSSLPNGDAAELAGVVQPSPGTTGTTGPRGLNTADGYGAAMKEICEPSSATSKGKSNPISILVRPGFDVFLAGYIANKVALSYGSYSYLTSSSSGPNKDMWTRLFPSTDSQVRREYGGRYFLLSVRCKKD